jgi:hypothetical protein
MGWYTAIYNCTKGTYSTHEYKYGTERLQKVLEMEPGWEPNDTIVGGGHDGGYHLSAEDSVNSLKIFTLMQLI